MWIWPALLLAPVLTLTDQVTAYALVQYACAHKSVAVLNVVHGAFLASTVALAIQGWRQWRISAERRAGAAIDWDAWPRVLALVGTLCAALFSLVILAQWIAVWMLSPCVQ